MSTRKVQGGEYPRRVMHMLHDLEIAVGDDGSTVRLGFKWASVQKNEPVTLCVCIAPCKYPYECGLTVVECENCTPMGTGRVEDVWVGRFRDIPAYLISFEHERRSREYWGLYDSMRKAYGTEFGESSFVTVVRYERVS